jgi:hypothetical protein
MLAHDLFIAQKRFIIVGIKTERSHDQFRKIGAIPAIVDADLEKGVEKPAVF